MRRQRRLVAKHGHDSDDGEIRLLQVWIDMGKPSPGAPLPLPHGVHRGPQPLQPAAGSATDGCLLCYHRARASFPPLLLQSRVARTAGARCCKQASCCPKGAREWGLATHGGWVWYARRPGLVRTAAGCYTRRPGLLHTAARSATHGGRRCSLRRPAMLPTVPVLRRRCYDPPPTVLRAGVEAPAMGEAHGGVTGVVLH